MKFPSRWTLVPLRRILKSKLLNGPHQSGMEFGKGNRIVRMVDLYRGDRIYSDALDRVTYPRRLDEQQYALRPGDILLNRTSVKREGIGKAAIVEGVSEPTFFDCSIIRVRPDATVVDPKYLLRALNGPCCRPQVLGRAKTATITTVSQPDIESIEIPLPPLAEQRRIASMLHRAETLQAKRRAALANFDILGRSLFLDLFGDPATNPKGWPIQQLKDVVKQGTIVTYGIVQAGEEFPGGVPYIRTGDIVDGEIVASGLRHTDPAIAAKFRRSRVEAGDIVMSIRATVGTTALVPPELDGANLTQGTGKISPGKNTDRLYLLNYLRASGTQHWISLQIKGATFREITLARLRELPVAVPPMTLQREFASRMAVIENLKASQHTSLAEMAALFASLEYRAFRGEL